MLSLVGARRLQLAAQGLLQPIRRIPRRADVVAAIQRMGMLQIDTIQVVARSPYLVLHSRLGDYPMSWLDDALTLGRVAECWAHEACFVSAADISWHRQALELRGHHWAHRSAHRMRREQAAGMLALLERVRSSGCVRSADFQRNAENSGAPGWWQWKPEKRWLEAWFALGELMVSRRERFQRVYDLTSRVLAQLDPPPDQAIPSCTPQQVRQRFLIDSVRALGIAPASWLADYHRLRPMATDVELAPLCHSGELHEVQVDTWDRPGYVHRDHLLLLNKARQGRLRATHTTVLSPFDPLVWDRQRLRAMFDFDYALECYTPAAKRRFGYFVLPLLHRGRLIGRLDAKAHRAAGVFEIRQLWLEPQVKITHVLVMRVVESLRRTARWHGTPQVRLTTAHPTASLKVWRAAFQAAEGKLGPL